MAYTPVVALDGNNAAQSMGALQDASGNNFPQVNLDSNRPTYRAAASFTPFATAALTVVKLTGSASKTVRVKRILLGGTATALSNTLFKLIRVSAIGAGGTAVNPTVAKNDTASAAATAVATHYTTAANAADTTAEGPLSCFNLFQSTVTTPTVAFCEPQCVYPERGAPAGQSIILRTTSEILAITCFNGGNMAAGSILQYAIEWEEDNS